jgi:Flp pilus assembly secretin CpaC
MTALSLCLRGPASQPLLATLLAGLLTWIAATLLVAALTAPAAADEPIVVSLDRARIVKLPERATTVVVGDPLIADVSIEHGGIIVITGKGYGATNLIVMDKGGAVLMEKSVEVMGPTDPTVVVYRGVNQETYSCTPICQHRITLGDTPDSFDKTLNQVTTRNSQAASAAGH